MALRRGKAIEAVMASKCPRVQMTEPGSGQNMLGRDRTTLADWELVSTENYLEFDRSEPQGNSRYIKFWSHLSVLHYRRGQEL